MYARLMRVLRALPELWIILASGLALSVGRLLAPPGFEASLGWQIHPYQVFATLAALTVFCLPGAMLMRLLGIGGSWPTRLPACFVTAVGLWSIPEFVMGGSGRFPLQDILAVGSGLTILLTIAAIVRQWLHSDQPDDVADEGRLDHGQSLDKGLVVLAGVGMLVVMLVSFAAPVGVDDHLQLMYTQDDLVVPHVNEFEPVFGAGIRPSTRGSLTTWPINLAVLTTLTGLPAQQMFWILRTPLALLGILAFYTFCLRFSGRRNQALLTTVFYILMALVLTTEAEALGFGIFVRAAQDKFVVRYLLFPIALAWSLAYLKTPRLPTYVLAGVCTFGLATTHTIGALLLGIPLAALGILHVLNHFQGESLRAFGKLTAWPALAKELLRRNWPMLRPYVVLSVFSLVGLAIPVLQKASPDAPVVAYSLTDTRDPTLWYRVALATNMNRLLVANYLGAEGYVVHPSVFLNPIIFLPAFALPFLWRKGRKEMIIELVVGTFILNSAMLLVPPIVQFIGQRATPWLLYRFVWPLTLLGPVVIGWVGWEAIERLRAISAVKRFSPLLPSAALIALAVLEAGAIYRGQVFLIETRANNVSGQCRDLQPLLTHMPDLVGQGTVVLTTADMELCLVSSAANAYPVEFGLTTTFNRFPQSRLSEASRRIADVYSFTVADVVDQSIMDSLARWNVGLILLRDDHPLVSQLRHMPWAFRLELRESNHQVFRVLPEAGVNVLPEVDVQERWKTAAWTGEDPLVAANTLLTDGRWEEAIDALRTLRDRPDTKPAAAVTLALGRAYLGAGEAGQAIEALTQAAALDPQDPQARILLGESAWLQMDFSAMADAYHEAAAMLPWDDQVWRRLGDAYRLEGKTNDAYQAYGQSAALLGPRGTSVYYLSLATMYSASGWSDEAIATLNRAIRIRETVGADAVLAALHIRQKNLVAAERVARRAQYVDFWSDQPYISLGRIALERLEYSRAISLFRQAILRRPQSPAFLPLTTTIGARDGLPAALEEVKKTIGYKLGFALPLQTAGRNQLRLGEVEEALATASQAWAWNPTSNPGAILLGDINFILGNFEEAATYYRTATEVGLAQDEPDTAAYLGLSSLAQARGDWQTAIGLDWAGMMAAPNASGPVTSLGSTYAALGEPAKADATYRFAVSLNPYMPGPYIALGGFEGGQGLFEEALTDFHLAVELRPGATAGYFGQAITSLDFGKVDEAEEALRASVEMNPGDGASRVALAGVLAQKGDFPGAVDQLNTALRLDPGQRGAYTTLAELLVRLGRTSEAEQVYQRMLGLMPEFEDAYVGLGRLRERRGDWEGAAEFYRQAQAEVAPAISGQAGLALADLMRRQGRADLALASYESVLERQPMLASGYLGLAQFHAQRGELAASERILRLGLDRMPASPELGAALAQVLVNQGDVKQGLKIYERALAVSPASADLLIGLANLHARIGEPAEALRQIQLAVERVPGETRILEQAVETAMAAGEPQTALTLAEELTSLSPGRAQSWLALAVALSASGDFGQAQDAYQRAVQIEPGSSQAWLSLGVFLSSRARTEESIAAIQGAIRADEADVVPHLRLAELYEKHGRLADAAKEYGIAAARDATQSSALLALGRMHMRQGQLAEARQWFERAKAASPVDPDVYRARAELASIEGKTEGARRELVDATTIAPASCEAHIQLADFLAERGDRASAEEGYRRVLSLAGCQSAAHIGLGNLLGAMAEGEGALHQYNQALASEPSDPLAYIAVANAQFSLARAEDALNTMSLAEDRLPASELLEIAYGRSLVYRGRLQEGVEKARKAIADNPSSPYGRVMLGQILQLLGKPDEAERAFVEAGNADPTSPFSLLALGDLYQGSARFDEAEKAYQAAIARAPTAPRSYVALGDYLSVRGRTAEAVAVYQQGADVDRSQIDALLALGVVYLRTGDLVGAETLLERTLDIAPSQVTTFRDPAQIVATAELPPTLSQAYVAMGDLSRARGDWTGAERAYRKAIELAPASPAGYLGLGRAYLAEARAEEALAQFDAATKAAPASASAWIALGDWHRLQADWQKAIASYESARTAAPMDLESYLRLGGVHQFLGRSADASAQFQAAVDTFPASATAYRALGDWRRAQADRAGAEEAYRLAIRARASDPGGYLGLGRVYQDTGRQADALAQFREALEVAPVSSPAHIAVGDWYWDGGDWVNAESVFRHANRDAPLNIEIYLRLAEVLEAADRSGEAWRLIDTALRLVPGSAAAHVALGDWDRLEADASDAQEMFRQVLAEASEDVKLSVRAGLDELGHGDVEGAYEQFEEAIATDPESMLPYLAMGQVYRLSAGLLAAEHEYLEAITLEPAYIPSYVRLADLYLAEGRRGEALAVVEAAIEIAPGSTEAYVALGNWHWVNGDWLAAEEAYRTAIKLVPGNLEAYMRLGEAYQAQGRINEALAQFEAALVAGLATETTVCGPPRLPSMPGDTAGEDTELADLYPRSPWRCQWSRRLWSNRVIRAAVFLDWHLASGSALDAGR